jgi:hypothetical protein
MVVVCLLICCQLACSVCLSDALAGWLDLLDGQELVGCRLVGCLLGWLLVVGLVGCCCWWWLVVGGCQWLVHRHPWASAREEYRGRKSNLHMTDSMFSKKRGGVHVSKRDIDAGVAVMTRITN